MNPELQPEESPPERKKSDSSTRVDGGDILQEIVKLGVETQRKNDYFKWKLAELATNADTLRTQEGPSAYLHAINESKLIIVEQVILLSMSELCLYMFPDSNRSRNKTSFRRRPY